EDAYDSIFEWNDEDAWFDGDQLVIQAGKVDELTVDGDMLYLSTGSLIHARTICEKLGLTAGPPGS
ncbi:MAG: hypothetical protein QGG40_17720, partial [Myxococcota bacterium]|nr:hypothetical protein [Myxococcota bacterium]